tara:strand:- start:234 stop:431 length:198 start_codon:yes stop_codon:yes gene_type:complete
MDYEKMGICVTILVLVTVIGFAGISSGDLDVGIDTGEIKLPQINAGTNTNHDGFYDYCYRMGLDC